MIHIGFDVLYLALALMVVVLFVLCIFYVIARGCESFYL